MIASKLAHQLAGKPIEFLLEELREKKGGARDTDTNQAKTSPSLWAHHPKVNTAYVSLPRKLNLLLLFTITVIAVRPPTVSLMVDREVTEASDTASQAS